MESNALPVLARGRFRDAGDWGRPSAFGTEHLCDEDVSDAADPLSLMGDPDRLPIGARHNIR